MENAQPESLPSTPDFNSRAYSGYWSDFWRVTDRTVQRWKLAAERGEMPKPDATEQMLSWELTPGKKPPAFRRRCLELRRLKPGTWANPSGMAEGLGDGSILNPDWSDFLRDHPGDASPDQVKQIQNLERHLHFADYALQRARARNDAHCIKIYTDDVIRFSKAIKEQKALADKLGVESGELLQRPEVERVEAAWAYWSMASIDLVLPSLCKRVVGLKSPSEARAILEPALLRAKFLEPFQQAKRVAAGNNLPPWFVEKMVDSVDDYLESGRELLTAPVPDNGPTPIP